MKILLALFSVLYFSIAWGCNISENELVLRVAVIKVAQTEQMSLHGINLSPHEYEDSNISKKEFIKLIDSVKKVYVPIFKNNKMNFKVEHLWDDKQENAFAGVRGNDRYILLYGGYARHKLMTKDAFLSIICHEIGHHLGGFPKKVGNAWSSSEGQADYFSTLKCMKEVLRRDPENQFLATKVAETLHPEVKKQCLYQFPNENEYNICLRSSKAAEEHGIVIADMKGENTSISLLTPSTERETVTNLKHPSSQCRMDTKYQGALCNVSTLIPLDNNDETKGACTFNNFNILGNRPACWFVHKK